MQRVFVALLVSAVACLATAQEPPSKNSLPKLHRLAPQSPQELQSLLRYTGDPMPLVSAHRGGPRAGFPENCLATFEHTLQHTFALLEIDPRYTKDGEIVLLHDATLERTTTGRGRATDLTLAELQQLRLRDSKGKPTDFRIPTLDETLEWARGKTVLVIDQKDVPVAARVKKVTEHKAEAYALLIVYSFADAQECYRLNPNVMMEVMIPTLEKFAEFSKLGIPWRNVIAFVGHTPPEDEKLYQLIHEQNVCCLIGTSRNLDRQVLAKKVDSIQALEAEYRAFLKRGADLIETDIPIDVGTLLASTPVPRSKRSLFRSPDERPQP